MKRQKKRRFWKNIQLLTNQKNQVMYSIRINVGEQKLYLLKLLDYVRAYSSVLAGVEPLGVPFMNHMKERMNETPWPDNDPLPGAQR